MLQALGLDEPDYRGSVFEDHPAPLKGNYDALNLSRPELVADVHRAYLDAGADIIKTNSFNSTRIAQSDYELVDRAAELNAAAAPPGSRGSARTSSQRPTGRASWRVCWGPPTARRPSLPT